MKKISRTPEIPKPTQTIAYSRKRINESMQLLFPRDINKQPIKESAFNFMSKGNSTSSTNSKSQTIIARQNVNHERNSCGKTSLSLTKTYSLSKTILTDGTKLSAPSRAQDNSVSPLRETKSPRGTFSTIRKGQLPDSIVKLLGEYKGGFKDVGDFKVTIDCIMHQHKKAKFMVRGVMRAPGLCSKCAVKLAKEGNWVEEIIEENPEQAKKMQLKDFLSDLNHVFDKYDELERTKNAKINECLSTAQKKITMIETLFNDLKNILDDKKNLWINSIKSDADSAGYDLVNYGRWINDNRSELNLMKNDIKANYSDIIERVDKSKFVEILSHFREKLQEIDACGHETSLGELQSVGNIDSKAITSQFDMAVERILMSTTKGGYLKSNLGGPRINSRFDNFVVSQTGSIKPLTSESGVSIDFGKVGLDNIYFNYNCDRFNENSCRVNSDTLLSKETLKQTSSLALIKSFKQPL